MLFLRFYGVIKNYKINSPKHKHTRKFIIFVLYTPEGTFTIYLLSMSKLRNFLIQYYIKTSVIGPYIVPGK